MRKPIKLYIAALELTLACLCRCRTCGSNAGKPREDELSTEEWLVVVRDLADMGCRRIALLGGEPLLRRDWVVIAEEAVKHSVRVEMITSGIGVDAETARLVRDAGVVSVTVSVDGTRAVHDRQREVNGGFEQALCAIALFDRAGLRVGVTTQINQQTLPTLDALAPHLEDAGAIGWQLQLTIPCGRALGQSGIAIDPDQMPDVYRTIRRLVQRRGLRPYITDNIGYLTSDDPVLRTPPGTPARCWLGCSAGLRAIGVSSNGSVKGCLALPDEMLEGNVREENLKRIWSDPKRFAYNRAFDPQNLSGACGTCVYGPVCRGGCTATAIAIHGKPGVSTHCFRLHATA